jgi:hypothetical protein
MPIAASWIRSRVDDLFSGPFFFFSVILFFCPEFFDFREVLLQQGRQLFTSRGTDST